mmetsp:Transcript_15084/g.20210  ORF Transcript_15084/g.20210 Transcript_15084/m.20210 type:complete len:107 (-) Transcript_15084:238-558(-)|eukprot:CAMPEP_0185774572 /NCGR_PEP_ID=MMETSP1174-20130828/78870_1 /TAXON_ID=35687 /ORGANISM="Dictyocha speculum, Strain CCMP1381" /LENGTH=106 /DNA_ID=CAMNT_0028461803 /DNA_START=282 /DNA_END=602 /DNA_ORIENTATION=+
MPNPTYDTIGDYTEALRVTFNPKLMTFNDILKSYLSMHTPMPESFTKLQYRSAVWFEGGKQEASVREALADFKAGSYVHVASLDSTSFYRAEEYHQNFIKKNMFGN